MAFDHKIFANELGMSEEDRTALDALFVKYPSAGTKIDGVLTAQVEARLTPLQQAIEVKQRELDAQFDTLATVRTGDSETLDRLQHQFEKTTGERAVLEARFRKVAAESGLNADELLKDLTPAEPAPKAAKTTETFGRDDIMALSNIAALSAFENAALLEDLAAEHQTLFGKPMSRADLIQTLREDVKKTQNPNLGLRDVFERKFNVAAKREELNEAAVQKRINDAVSARETSLRDEMALRSSSAAPTNPNHAPSPIFAGVGDSAKPVAIKGIDPGVSAAILDFRKRQSERKTA